VTLESITSSPLSSSTPYSSSSSSFRTDGADCEGGAATCKGEIFRTLVIGCFVLKALVSEKGEALGLVCVKDLEMQAVDRSRAIFNDIYLFSLLHTVQSLLYSA
jgi:hypothetical protein